MTKTEFLSKTPWFINHDTHGYAERELKVSSDKIYVFYKHANNLSSFTTSGDSYQSIYNKLSKGLIESGYMK